MIYKEWVADCGLRHSRTAGGDPSGNSTAELAVKWTKSRVRALLKEAGAEDGDWPLAAQQATATAWAKAFPHSPTTRMPATPFGHEVWFRAKAYKGTAEKRHDPIGARWKRGWYRGPSYDVSRGHIILREDGGLTIAKSVKFNVVNPEVECKDLLSPATAEGLPEELLQEEQPPSKGQLKDEVEFRARKLHEERDYRVECVVELYGLLEMLGDVDRRVSKKASMSSWYTGAFVHGGVAGLRNNTKKFPWTTTYLTSAARTYCKDASFSTLALVKNSQLGLHRDVHNNGNSTNYVIPMKAFENGSIWVQNDEVDDESGEPRTLQNGKVVYGKIHEMVVGEPVSFFHRRGHEVQPWTGERLMLLLFTPRGNKLTEENGKDLVEAGFSLLPDVPADEEVEEEIAEDEVTEAEEIAAVKVLNLPPHHGVAFEEMDDEEFFTPTLEEEGAPINDNLIACNVGNLKRLLKKAEVQYTPNIEDILEQLEKTGKPLEVTHTVSLGDVRKNIENWRESALKEFRNLTETKRAFSVRKRADLPPGCRIVPCKGVYTVKPDKRGYRRKTRFVACGNHVPEDGATDLFATGVDATSLRTMMAFNAKKPWRTGTTDVRQTFVLAKWKGPPVAMEPPSIAYELGIAERGDMWYVEQAIYGLRESPALWSQYRDEELKGARWKSDLNGEQVVMKWNR